MTKSTPEQTLAYLIEYITENLAELEDITSHDKNQFAYGEKTAYVEILELIKYCLEKAEEYGLDFEIEIRFPL